VAAHRPWRPVAVSVPKRMCLAVSPCMTGTQRHSASLKSCNRAAAARPRVLGRHQLAKLLSNPCMSLPVKLRSSSPNGHLCHIWRNDASHRYNPRGGHRRCRRRDGRGRACSCRHPRGYRHDGQLLLPVARGLARSGGAAHRAGCQRGDQAGLPGPALHGAAPGQSDAQAGQARLPGRDHRHHDQRWHLQLLGQLAARPGGGLPVQAQGARAAGNHRHRGERPQPVPGADDHQPDRRVPAAGLPAGTEQPRNHHADADHGQRQRGTADHRHDLLRPELANWRRARPRTRSWPRTASRWPRRSATC